MLVLLVGLVIDADDQQEVGRGLGDSHALLLDLLRQAREGRLHRILDLHLGDVGVGALLEGDVDGDLPARARRGLEIEQAVEPGQLLLDDLGDAVLRPSRAEAPG